jgi:flagellar hook assembly protein FlgD
MSRFILLFAVLLPISAVASVEISDISVTVPFFSPDGDGVQDMTGIRFEIVSDQAEVYLWVTVTDQAGTPVKTLAEGEARSPGSVYKIWDGSRGSGVPAAEGVYEFEVIAIAGPDSDGPYFAAVVLDVTPPDFTTLIYPSPYAPGLPLADSVLTVEVTVTNSEPDDWLSAWLIAGAEPETLCTQQVVYSDTSYVCTWDGRSKEDGVYELSVQMWDRAGNAGQGLYLINLDLEGPVISIDSPAAAYLDSFPTSVHGTIDDRNGVDWIGVRFSAGMDYTEVEPYDPGQPEEPQQWSIGWPETLDSEGTYDIGVLARDSVGYETSAVRTVTVDMTPPSVPEFSPVPEKVGQPDLAVSGTCSPNDSVVIFVNGWVNARTVCNPAGAFVAPIQLELGANSIHAVGRDRSGNQSEQSETIVVTYEEVAGINVPERLPSDVDPEVNLTKDPDQIALRIYSIDGYYIQTLVPKDLPPSRHNEFEWDLTDADGRPVKNGLYLLVFEIVYADDTEDIEKRVVVVAR